MIAVVDDKEPIRTALRRLLRSAGFDVETSTETRDQALAGGPVAYLRKPVNDQTLLDAIAVAIKQRP